MFNVIRDLNHQNWLDKNFASLMRAKDKLGKSNLSFGVTVSDTGFLSRQSIEVLQPASAMYEVD